MTPTFVDKLYTNFVNSWKMHSVQALAFFGLLGSWFATLPTAAKDCAATAPDCLTQTAVLQHLPIPSACIPMVIGFVIYYLRIHPQASITPDVAEAKSAAGPTTLDFPLPTGHAPLPTLPPHGE